MKVLITGGSGFVGQHLVSALVSAGEEVAVIDRHAPPPSILRQVQFFRGDISRPSDVDEAIQKTRDVVVHLAARTSVQLSWSNSLVTTGVNIFGTVALLDAMKRRNRPCRFIFASSAAVYGEARRLPVREGDACNPLTPYGASKLAAEHYVRLFTSPKLETVILRYFNLYGSFGRNNGSVVETFVYRALRGDNLPVDGDGTQVRDFLHVKDAVEATVRAASVPRLTGEVMNIGSGKCTSILGLANLIRSSFNANVSIEFRPPREGEIRRSCANIGLAHVHLGWAPRIMLSEGIRKLAGRA